MADFKINVVLDGAQTAVSTVGEIQKALKQTKEELKGIEVGSEAFTTLTEQARTLQRELKDVKEATNFEQNIGQTTEAVSRLASTVASSFAVATTAYELFGTKSEDVSKAQIKAQQAITVALSAATIAANANRLAEDARTAGILLQTGIQKLLTLAIGRDVVVKAADAVATGTATAAQLALNAAMSANPILLLVTALGILVGAIVAFSDDTEDATKSTEELTEAKKELIKEIDRSTKAYSEEIDRQKELIKLQGQIKEADATTQTEKLKLRLETQTKLSQLDEEDLQNQIKGVEAKLEPFKKQLDTEVILQQIQIDRLKDLKDFDANNALSAQQKELAGLINRQKLGLVSEEKYYEELSKIRIKYSLDPKIAKEEKDRFVDLLDQGKQLNGALKSLNDTRTLNEQLTNAEINKAFAENAKKRKDELAAYNKDIEALNKKRVDEARKSDRELEQSRLENISQVTSEITLITRQGDREVKDTFISTNEDIIKGYDERIAKARFSYENSKTDARAAFEEELKAFQEAEKKRVDANGKRVISDAQIGKAIAEQRRLFDEAELKDKQNLDSLITGIEQEKANKIKEIDGVLKNELAFGDNQLNDNRKKIALEQIESELDLSRRKLELEDFNRVESIKILNALNKQRIEAIRASQLEELKIQTQEALKSVQGTEEQKGKQRVAIEDLYNEQVSRLNDDLNLQIKEADKKTQDEIAAYRLQKLNEYVKAATDIANSILALSSAIAEGEKINSDLRIRENRDAAVQQTNDLNSEYEKQVINLQKQRELGFITEQQYNTSVKALDNGLAKDKKAIQNKQREFENAEREKAFNQDKKLKKAQAIIAGFQGAVSAFTGAMQLGPIAGPIVGAVLAGAIAAATAVQVNNIEKTKFDSGPPEAVEPNIPDVTSIQNTTTPGTAGGMTTPASTGGFTGFQPGLVGPSAVGTEPGPRRSNPEADIQPIKVVVLESDITNAQKRVSVSEANSTF